MIDFRTALQGVTEEQTAIVMSSCIVCYILHRHLGMSSTEVGKMLNRDIPLCWRQ